MNDHLDKASAKLDAWAAEEADRAHVVPSKRDTAIPDVPDLATPVELGDLLERQMPKREWLLDGLIQMRDLGMIHAYRGVGKSRVVHGIAVAVSGGGRFLRWQATRPQGVLLVDGELPREDLQAMLAQAVGAADAEPEAPLYVLSSDLSDAPVLSLATEKGREQVERYLSDISLLILDSITTLCPGSGPENDAGSWDVMQTWLLELRRRGITVMLVHHDGKAGGQRGTSKREDVLSTVVQLRRPNDYRPSEGARFEIHYSKSRGIVGKAVDPFEARFEFDDDGHPCWTLQTLEDAKKRQVLALYQDGVTNQRDIAHETGIGLGTVNRKLKELREEGRIE